MALENVLSGIPGLGGYLATRQMDEQRAAQGLQQLLGVANLVEQQKARQQQAEAQRMHGLLYQAQANELQRKAQQDQEATSALSNLQQKFSQLQQPIQETDADGNLTQRPGMSHDQAFRAIATDMLFNPNPNVRTVAGGLINRIDVSDQARANREQRMQELQMRLEDKSLSEERRAQLSRELAEMRIEGQQNLARMAAALRQPREDRLINVIDPKDKNRVIGMPQSEYLERRRKGEVWAIAAPGVMGGINQKAARQAALQKEIEISNPVVKDFQKIRPFFESATEYIAGIKQDPQKKTSASDRALFFQYQRMLDPNDRVSEGDYRGLLRLGGLDERFVQYIVGMTEGQVLPDRVRNDMFNVMRRQFTNMNSQVKSVESRYRDRMKSQDLDPDDLPKISVDLQ